MGVKANSVSFLKHKSDAKLLNENGGYRDNSYRCKWLRKNINDVKILLIEADIPNWGLAKEREKYWIKYYRDNGYKLVNTTDGGDGTNGYKFPEEIKQKIKQSNTGKKTYQ